jgi:hypothetical protein
MTREGILKRTIALADAWMERELERAEITLFDLGGTPAEIEAAIAPGGYFYKLLREDRDAQIRETERWLAGNDGTRH